MPVVINEFEVVPAQPSAETRSPGEKPEESGENKKNPISDFEAKKMMTRVLERLERVSAH